MPGGSARRPSTEDGDHFAVRFVGPRLPDFSGRLSLLQVGWSVGAPPQRVSRLAIAHAAACSRDSRGLCRALVGLT